MKCKVCEAGDCKPYLKVSDYDILKCSSCGHGHTNPVPNDEELNRMYNEAYFDDQYIDVRLGTSEFDRRLRGYTKKVIEIQNYYKGGKLIDIGCGMGSFAYAAKKCGFDAHAFDVTDANRDTIENELGIPLHVGAIEQIDPKEKNFDVVTMWHSLEHQRDVRRTLEVVSKILEPGGLVVIEVPNHDCVDALELKEKWEAWQPPFHIHHFSKNSLMTLLDKYNYEVLATETYHSEYIKNKYKRNMLTKPFARMIAKRHDSTSIRVICRAHN